MTETPSDSWDFDGACDAPGRFKGRCVGHRITIEAPPELVWDFLADFEGWKSWNPLYPFSGGNFEEGAQVRFAVQLEGLKPLKGKALVRTLRPNELIEYATGIPGLFRALRFIEVEELLPTRCRVANGEILGGPLGGLLSRAISPKVVRGLAAMNAALKAVAERKWQGRPA